MRRARSSAPKPTSTIFGGLVRRPISFLKFLLIPIREALSRLNAVLTRMLVDQSRKLVLSKQGKIRSVVERLGDCITSERSALQLKQNQAALGVYAQKIQWSASVGN